MAAAVKDRGTNFHGAARTADAPAGIRSDARDPATERQAHSTNLVGLPPGLLGSTRFNDHPCPLHIHGTRESNPELFTRLEACPSLSDAGVMFQDYMDIVFGQETQRRRAPGHPGRRRYRSSYLGLLQDWGFDSNNPQGAVLKGWAESRLGLFPTFHKAPLTRYGGYEWMRYVEEKMNSRYHNNCILLQLDLLFEFCQLALRRFTHPNSSHLVLYRGIDTLDAFHADVSEEPGEHVIRLNNVVSFTRDQSIATEFGAHVLEARVPVVKLIFFSELLPAHALRGEGEVIAIGGNYRVRLLR